MQIKIYTDGACDIHADNQPGGWAAILQAAGEDGAVMKEKVISGGAENTTNNRMELAAVTEGLRLLTRATAVTVVTDSRYVIDIATKRKKLVKNESLWDSYFRIADKHEIDWKYVAGHSGNALNERCDRLAVAEKNRRAKPKPRSAGETAAIPNGMAGIYLSTRYSAKSKTTAWAALIICGETEREASARLAKSSELEGTLVGAISCLESLPAAQDAIVFTAQEYLSKGMNHWLDGWIKKGWKTRSGESVKYRKQWERLRQLTAGREVRFNFIKSREDIAEFRRGKELTAEVLNRA
jgi:ribonuclease HI